MFFSDFFKQIGDANVLGHTAKQQWGFNCRPNVVGVNVAVVQPITTNDDDRISQRAPCRFKF